MRNRFSKCSIALIGTMMLLCFGPRASASLFATFNLNQGVYEYGSPFANSYQSTPLASAALPLNTTLTQTTATNSITATYKAFDNGTSAGFSVNCSAYFSATGNQVGEEAGLVPNDGSYTTFSFTEPVNYSVSYQSTGNTPGGELLVVSPSPYQAPIGYDPSPAYPSFSQTGTLPANDVFQMTEFWALSNQSNSGPANETGTDSLSFTF